MRLRLWGRPELRLGCRPGLRLWSGPVVLLRCWPRLRLWGGAEVRLRCWPRLRLWGRPELGLGRPRLRSGSRLRLGGWLRSRLRLLWLRLNRTNLRLWLRGGSVIRLHGPDLRLTRSVVRLDRPNLWLIRSVVRLHGPDLRLAWTIFRLNGSRDFAWSVAGLAGANFGLNGSHLRLSGAGWLYLRAIV